MTRIRGQHSREGEREQGRGIYPKLPTQGQGRVEETLGWGRVGRKASEAGRGWGSPYLVRSGSPRHLLL